MCQIYVIEPNGFAVADDGLFVGFGVLPFEQARAQDFECTVCGLGFLFAVNGLAEVAADTVGVIIEFFRASTASACAKPIAEESSAAAVRVNSRVVFMFWFLVRRDGFSIDVMV